MGVCYFRYTKIVNASPNQRKSKLKSCRSSIYQINKENINDLYEFPQNFQVATTELCRRQISRTTHRNSTLLNRYQNRI